MSFPSLPAIAAERGINLSSLEDEAVARGLIVEAIRRDCGEAVEFLHQKVHEADEASAPITFSMNPNSELGKKIIRLFAADGVREIVQKHFLHGRKIVFYNCCAGVVPPKDDPKPQASALMQIRTQAGPIAYADC